MSEPTRINCAERGSLIFLIRQREKVAKDIKVLKIAEANERRLIASLVGRMRSRCG
jgi:hypothetical protein